MQPLPKWVLPPSLPSIYDSESFTALEMVAKVYGAMSELITEYNAFAENVNTNIAEFEAATEEERKLFEIAMRQEFQDFIDAVDLKVRHLEEEINDTKSDIAAVVNAAIQSGDIYITESYDPETESLTMTVTGGVENV